LGEGKGRDEETPDCPLKKKKFPETTRGVMKEDVYRNSASQNGRGPAITGGSGCEKRGEDKTRGERKTHGSGREKNTNGRSHRLIKKPVDSFKKTKTRSRRGGGTN